MKKTLSIILTAVMVLGLLAVVPMTVSAAPAGTAVKTEAEFLAMDPAGAYYLDADITLTQTYAQTFTGTFDGNGKTVTISAPMFGTVENATISNFTVAGEIKTTEATAYVVGSDNFIAAVAVYANGKTTFSGITSNVNITCEEAATKAAAIAAFSAADYDLTIDNCVNNGNITVVKYAGGIYGWSSKVGKGYIKNCINNGNVTAAGYAGGIANRLSGKTEGITLTIENCINTGKITATNSYAGGIYAYGESYIQVTGCINRGDVLAQGASGSTGGIVANLGDVGKPGNHIIKNNINFANVTNEAAKNTGGIVGYVNGGGERYVHAEGNINFGTVSSQGYCSQIVGYTNSNLTVIINNIGAGKLVGADPLRAVMVGLSSHQIENYTIKDNYYIENDGTMQYSYADKDENATNRVALDARPEGSVIFVAADKFSNGEVATALNTAVGSTMFEVKDGKTVLICTHEYPTVDGKCAACGIDASNIHKHTLEDIPAKAPTCTEKGAEAGKKCSSCDYIEGCKEIAALGHKFADGKCSVCQADDPDYVAPTTTTQGTTAGEAPEVTTTEAPQGDKGCGGISVFAALIAIVSGAAVVIFKKKA